MYIVNLLWTDRINRSLIKQIINIVVVNFKVRHKHCIAVVFIHLKTNQSGHFLKRVVLFSICCLINCIFDRNKQSAMPGAAYFRKIEWFTEDHYICGELFMEF